MIGPTAPAGEAAPTTAVPAAATARPALPSLLDREGRTDDANGRRLAAACGDKLRWCQVWKTWLVWTGKCWARDNELRAEALAKDVARHIWNEVFDLQQEMDNPHELYKFAKATSSSNGIASMLSLCKSEPGISILPDALDRDPWLFNVQNGTIDLRSGKLQPHNQADLLTKISPVEFDPKATCPRWMRFMNELFPGDQEMITYMQKDGGYALTGVVRDQVLFFLYGAGQNGKSTFLNILQTVFGPDYSMRAAPELLIAKKQESHPAALADLHGKRLVIATEASENRWLNESRIKDLTGGDPIRARELYAAFFEFLPTHKLIMCGNHKPPVADRSEGFWRRMKLIGFEQQFAVGKNADTTLLDKLRGELSGIFNWLLAGCRLWQATGLQPEPEKVKLATASYRTAQDIFGQFFSEHCVLDSNGETMANTFRYRYDEWCKLNGERPLSSRRFAECLADRGITKRKTNGLTCYVGVSLVPVSKAAESSPATPAPSSSSSSPPYNKWRQQELEVLKPGGAA